MKSRKSSILFIAISFVLLETPPLKAADHEPPAITNPEDAPPKNFRPEEVYPELKKHRLILDEAFKSLPKFEVEGMECKSKRGYTLQVECVADVAGVKNECVFEWDDDGSYRIYSSITKSTQENGWDIQKYIESGDPYVEKQVPIPPNEVGETARKMLAKYCGADGEKHRVTGFRNIVKTKKTTHQKGYECNFLDWSEAFAGRGFEAPKRDVSCKKKLSDGKIFECLAPSPESAGKVGGIQMKVITREYKGETTPLYKLEASVIASRPFAPGTDFFSRADSLLEEVCP